MSVLQLPVPQLDACASLHVERTDINFSNIRPDVVHIEIAFCNQGEERSQPTTARVMAAALGTFVPWRPLTTIDVPELRPGERFVGQARATRLPRSPLGDPNRLPPARLLTALAADDDRPDRKVSPLTNLLGHLWKGAQPAQAPGTLPGDPLELLGRSNPHWAGNLNVFVGNQAVERHLAQALRVYPGQTNLAVFIVGSRPDSYAFRMEGDGADWDAALYHMAANMSAIDPRRGTVVAHEQWIKTQGQALMMLALCPPTTAARGTVEVHVKQRSTGQEAIVEFSLDARAAGPGCFVV